MLELQKITELEKPNKLDQFKKAITTNKNKEVPTLDFFKTSHLRKKRTPLTKSTEKIILSFAFVFSGFMFYTDSEEKKYREIILEQQEQTYNLAKTIGSELDEKNTFNINLFNKLKSSPTTYADHASATIINRLLANNKVSLDVKDKVFKSYIQHWNSGIKKEEEFYKNCSTVACSTYVYNAEAARNHILPYLEKTLAFAKHPDMFEKYMELEELKKRHSVVIN